MVDMVLVLLEGSKLMLLVLVVKDWKGEYVKLFE